VNDFDPNKWNYKPPPKFSNNTPAHMKSIWSKNYIPFKSSTPFGNLIIQNKINRPNTLGIAKAIASPFDNKRKIEHVKKESNSQYTSSASSSADSDYITDENDYTESDKKKIEN